MRQAQCAEKTNNLGTRLYVTPRGALGGLARFATTLVASASFISIGQRASFSVHGRPVEEEQPGVHLEDRVEEAVPIVPVGACACVCFRSWCGNGCFGLVWHNSHWHTRSRKVTATHT